MTRVVIYSQIMSVSNEKRLVLPNSGVPLSPQAI